MHNSCEFPLLQLPRKELSSLSTRSMIVFYLLFFHFFFEVYSWSIVKQIRQLLMLVKVRHMVIRFPISAGLSRSALLLVWTPALRGLESHYGSAVGSRQPCACSAESTCPSACRLTRGQWRYIDSALHNKRDDSPTITPFPPWMGKAWPI